MMGYIPLSQSKLSPSLFSENRRRDLDYLRLLDCDRMLYNFRSAYKADTRGAKPLNGWDSPDGLLRGHSTGHYLSALSLAVASGERELYPKLCYTVHCLRSLQMQCRGNAAGFKTACTPENPDSSLYSENPAAWGEGYLSAYPPDQFALLEQFTPYAGIWAPYYTLHKILQGLIDAHTLAAVPEALDCARGIGLWVYDRLSVISKADRERMWGMYIAGEYGGMNESLAVLSVLTGEPKFAAAAALFDNTRLFDALADAGDSNEAAAAIAGLHANQHIPQLVGAMAQYRATGSEYYHRAASNFFNAVTKHYLYATGGVGQGECFREPDKQAQYIKGDTNCETCAAYNLLKLAAALYEYDTKNSAYFDYYERALYNHIASSQNLRVHSHSHNGVTYMQPVGEGVRKSYSDDYNSFTCCHGTGMENHVKYPAHGVFTDGSTVYLNLYLPCEYSADGVKISVDNTFPFDRFNLTLSGGEYTAALRIPAWARFFRLSGASNERRGGYCYVRHPANSQITLSLEMPYRVRIEPTADKIGGRTVAAVMYGPFVMVSPCSDGDSRPEIQAQTRYRAETNLEAGAFYISGGGRLFVPMYFAHGFAYHTYFYVDGELKKHR